MLDLRAAQEFAAHGVREITSYGRAVHGQEGDPYQDSWELALREEHKLLIVCPPDTYKSTTVRWHVERAIGENPNIRILWLMATQDQANRQVAAVKETIENNEVYRQTYHVERGSKWETHQIYVKRADPNVVEPTLMATGLDGPYQGLHFDMIVVDDPTDPEDVRSDKVMENQRHKVRGVLMDRLVEGGRIVAILTPWGRDLISTFREIGFRVVRMPIVGSNYPWGPTLSPRRFTPEWIAAKHTEKGDALWTLTYLLDPTGAEGGIIKRKALRHWAKIRPDGTTEFRILPDTPLVIFIGVDPAMSENDFADPTAIATVGIDLATRKKYLLSMWAGRLEVPELEKMIYERILFTAGLQGVAIETIAYQRSLVQYLRRRAAQDGRTLPLVEIPYRTRRNVQDYALGIDRDKVGRAFYLAGLFSREELYLPPEGSTDLVDGVSLEGELCAVPNGDHDDRMDALAFACAAADAAVPPSFTVSLKAGGLPA